MNRINENSDAWRSLIEWSSANRIRLNLLRIEYYSNSSFTDFTRRQEGYVDTYSRV